MTQGVDIVAGCTDSAQPVIHPQFLAPGMHVTPVVPKELPSESVDKFDLVVRHNDGGAEGFFVGQESDYAGLPAGHFDGSYRGVDRSDAPTLADLVSGKGRRTCKRRPVDLLLQRAGLRTAVRRRRLPGLRAGKGGRHRTRAAHRMVPPRRAGLSSPRGPWVAFLSASALRG